MLRKFHDWMASRDAAMIGTKPEKWLTRLYLGPLLFIMIIAEVALSMVLPYSTGFRLCLLMAVVMLTICVWLFIRQYIYFSYKLGPGRIYRLFVYNMIVLACAYIIVVASPVVFHVRLNGPGQSKYDNSIFGRDINSVYRYLLMDLKTNMRDLEKKGLEYNDYYDSVSTSYTDEDIAYEKLSGYELQSADTIGSLNYALYQIIKEFENSYSLYDRSLEQTALGRDHFQNVIGRYGLKVRDLSFTEAKKVVFGHLEKNRNYVPDYYMFHEYEPKRGDFEKMLVPIAQCLLIKQQAVQLEDLVFLDTTSLLIGGILLVIVLAILASMLTFWRVHTVFALIALALSGFIIFIVDDSDLYLTEFEPIFLLDAIFITPVVSFLIFARKSPSKHINRVKLWMILVANFFIVIAPALVIDTLHTLGVDVYPAFNTYMPVVVIVPALILQWYFIRYYVALKYAPA